MGDVTGLKIMVTGAAGFVGQHVVAAALNRGHSVNAFVRKGAIQGPEGVTLFKGDLTLHPDILDAALAGVDAVIHLAGSLKDDADRQAVETLGGTKALLAGLSRLSSRPRLVLVSSIAVYSSDMGLSGTEIDENTPLEREPEQRDAYVAAKLGQERMCQVANLDELRILRPGAIYGPDQRWNAHIGVRKGPMLVRLGNAGQIPLTHVGNCAEAIVRAAEIPVLESPDILNLVDDDLPDRKRFLAGLRGTRPKYVLPVHWRLIHGLAQLAAKIPGQKRGLLRPAVVRARMMPVSYSNRRAKLRLDWAPKIRFEDGMRDAIAKGISHG